MRLNAFAKKKFDLEHLNATEIKKEELVLKNKLSRLRTEIQQKDARKKELFNAGLENSDPLMRKMIAHDLHLEDTASKLLMKDFLTLQKQYQLVSSLGLILTYKRDLVKTPLWTQLCGMDQSSLERSLVSLNLSGSNFDAVLSSLSNIVEQDLDSTANVVDPVEKEIFEIWNEVSSGHITAAEGEQRFTATSEMRGIELRL